MATEAEIAEAQRLESQIAHVENCIRRELAENERLEAELDVLIDSVLDMVNRIGVLDNEVDRSMAYVQKKVKTAENDTTELSMLIKEVTESYFTFKNLSTASKNVSQYTDEYFTKFKFFNELRRISLGYVVGLDAHICSDETMRKKVEKIYLQNTEYWLAYAAMAVMLWASDEREAAERALKKSVSMDYYKSTLFFLLINLRFTRVDVAKKWYIAYLDRVDQENLGNEWQYLLQAYLSGVFGVDDEFNRLVRKCFTDMLDKMATLHPYYGESVIEETVKRVDSYAHVTSTEFENLRRYCPDYNDMKMLLSAAEKNEKMAVHFREMIETDSTVEANMFQRIEDILYDLVNSYDDEELKVVKKRRENELIVRARGNVSEAMKAFKSEFPSEKNTRSLDSLLFEWAFSEDDTQVDITVKKFSVAYLKQWISKGFAKYAENYRKHEKEKYRVSIDGWEDECNENSFNEASASLEKYYNKNRLMDTLSDKYVKIFIGICIAELVLLIITAFKFNKVTLVMGILGGVAGGFLVWRRVSDMQLILKSKKDKAIAKLKNTLAEMAGWRRLYKTEDKKNEDLVKVFDNVDI